MFGYHLALQVQISSGLLRRGYLGVDGFFLLSGLLLAHVHPRLGFGWPELRAFWAKRLARIYPVHLATLAILVGLLIIGGEAGFTPNDPGRFGMRELVLNLLLLHGWGVSERWAWNYPSWSVSTEWLGYLLFPFLWAAIRMLPRGGLVAAPPIALALLLWVQHDSVGLNLTYEGALGRFFPEFVAGMATALLTPMIARHVAGQALAFGGICWMAASLAWASDAWVVPGLLLCMAGLLAAAIQSAPPILSRLPWLPEFGELSYAFYMSFALVETVQAQAWRALGWTPTARPLAYVAVASLGTFALAVALRRLVERPGLRLARGRASG